MSQDDFANIFHVSRQTVSNWENGKSLPRCRNAG
ncbi:helix-turn-helix domain-containing protein [Streptococcus infantarius]|nr:helix-turn-helix domain-containing protein [Streptococcus infantarius]